MISRRADFIGLVALVVCVLATRLPFILLGQLHFGSDQAVIGLMSLDLVQGDGFPVFMYGQKYLASIEPYLAAPLLAVFGPSRSALKFPLLILGLVTVVLIYVAFRRDTAATPRRALLLSAPFAIPSVLLASRTTEASGGHIEPFFFALCLWFLRRHPLRLGLVAGLAVQNRLFCTFAVCSLLCILIATRKWNVRHYARFVSAGAAVYLAIHFLGRIAPNYGGMDTPVRVSGPQDIVRLFRILCTELIPALYGVVPTDLSEFNIRSAAVLNPSAFGFLTGASLLVLLLSSMTMLRPKNVTHWEFPAYLVGIGLLNLVAFCLFQGDVLVDHMMIRYVLLSLFLFMGIAALISRTNWRPLVTATLLVWVALNAVQHATLFSDLIRSPPDDPYADLARLLRDRDVSVAAASYGDCYYLTFILGRDILVASTEFYRIRAYQQAFKSHTGPGRVAIYDRPADCPDAVQLHHWTVCPIPEDFQ